MTQTQATAQTTPLTEEQLAQWHERGFFIVRGAVPREVAVEARGVIRNHLLARDLSAGGGDPDPMDPMGDSPAARQARLRKLGDFCVRSPLIWHEIHCSERILDYARHFLGDDVLLKFNSCFLKPARTGSATPWHQDNGLWRDDETEPFNFWMALDPATRANGCLQFIPGSHTGPIVAHVLYEDSIHPELPREHVREMVQTHGLDHIELQPGDMVCWHSSLYHFSPPNRSDQSRIGVAGVYNSLTNIARSKRFKRFYWCLKAGELCTAFPPEQHILGDGQPEPAPPAQQLQGTLNPAAAGY